MGVHFVAGSVALPQPQTVVGGVPFGRQPTRAARRAVAAIAFNGPNSPRDEAGLWRDVVEPDHGPEAFEGRLPGLFVAGDGVLEGHCGEVMGRMAAVIIADLAQPALF